MPWGSVGMPWGGVGVPWGGVGMLGMPWGGVGTPWGDVGVPWGGAVGRCWAAAVRGAEPRGAGERLRPGALRQPRGPLEDALC